jgi:hypothetical protein
MSSSIYDKAQSLLKKGPSRSTLYSVRIGGGKVSDTANSYLDFFCYVTTIPGISAQTVAAVGQEHQGIYRETPGGILYSKPFTMQIIENSEYLTYYAIRKWFDEISPNTNQTSRPGSTGRAIRMNYYNDIVSNIQLTKLEIPASMKGFDRGGDMDRYYESPVKVNFINAYPVKIGEINLQSTSSDQPVIWQADFTYESYFLDKEDGRKLPTIPVLPPPPRL